MELHEIKITGWNKVKIHGDLVIAPITDVHWGNSACAREAFKDYIAYALDHNAVFISLGELCDFTSRGQADRLTEANLRDTTMSVIDQGALLAVEELADVLKLCAGRFLGLLEGHHYHVFTTPPEYKGMTTDQVLAKKLGGPFLGTCADLRIQIGKEPHEVIRIWAHHGAGGGMRVGAGLNRLELMSAYWPEFDLFLSGHLHRASAAPVPRIFTDWRYKPPRQYQKNVRLHSVAGWLKGYPAHHEEGGRQRGPYVERGMLYPQSILGSLVRCSGWYDGRAWIPECRVEV